MKEDFENIYLPDELIEILHDGDVPILEKMLARNKFYYDYFRQNGKFSVAEMYGDAVREVEERIEYEKLRKRT